jgi:hypothetical protein
VTEGDRRPDDEGIPDDHGVTAREQREGEPIDDRLVEEEPDQEDLGRRQAGRLIEEHDGLEDHEKDEVAEEAPGDTEDLSAEEASVRIDPDARGGSDRPEDRYVEEP